MEAYAPDIVVSTGSHMPASTTSSSSGNTDTALAEAPCSTSPNESSSNRTLGRVVEGKRVPQCRKRQPRLCGICLDWIELPEKGKRHRNCRDLVDRLGEGAAMKFEQVRRLADVDNKRKIADTNPAEDGTTNCVNKRHRSLQDSAQSEDPHGKANAALRALGLTFAEERKEYAWHKWRAHWGFLPGSARRVSDIPTAD